MKHSIQSKILIWLIIVIVSVGAFIGVLSSIEVKKLLLNSTTNFLHNVNSEDAKQMGQIFDNTSLFIKMVATRTRVVEYLQNQTLDKKKELVDIFVTFQKDNPHYVSIYLMDTTGSVDISTDRSSIGSNYGFHPYFREAMKGKQFVDVALGKTTNKIGYYFSYPAISAEGKVLGVAVVVLDPASSYAELDDNLGEESSIMMTDLNGIILYSTKKDRELKSLGVISASTQAELKKNNAYLGLKISPLGYEEIQRTIYAYTAPKTVQFSHKEDNEEELVSIARIINYPFYLVSEVELNSILSQIIQVAGTIGVQIFGAAVFALLLVSLVVRKILSPLSVLKKHAELIGKGDFTHKINIKSGDEFDELGSIFNQTQNHLQELYGNLEQKVRERTQVAESALIQMEEQNKALEQGKCAILNILEDERQLEEDLKKEKEGIEKKVNERTSQLNSEKSKLSASISSLPIGFIMVDKSHKVVLVNRKVQEILGLTKDRIKIFDDILSLFPKDSAIFKIHENYHIDKNFVVQTGEVVFGTKMLKVSIVPITKNTDEETEVLGSILLIDDITEEKVLERSKNEFFSIASHELRTPLTAIRGNTSMILDYYAKDLVNPDLITMITDTHSASVHLISIVNDFLDMSRLEQGKMEYKKEKVSPSEIVKKIMAALAVNALEKKIAILSTIDEKMVIWADYGKVEQILFNLIGNALKFTDKGTITISAKSEKDNVQIEVSDTGRGIPLASQNLLFRKFQQAGSSTVTRDTTQGTGLGLYISRLMAEGMGGKLSLVKSIDGEGSVFSLTLPIGNKRLVLQ